MLAIPPNHPTVPVTAVQIFWGACAIAGLLAVGWAAMHVGGNAAFLADIGQSWGALTVALDLLFLGIPVVAFAVIESHRVGMRWPWIRLPLAVPLPGAFLIPLFFLLRERALMRSRAASGKMGRI